MICLRHQINFVFIIIIFLIGQSYIFAFLKLKKALQLLAMKI